MLDKPYDYEYVTKEITSYYIIGSYSIQVDMEDQLGRLNCVIAPQQLVNS